MRSYQKNLGEICESSNLIRSYFLPESEEGRAHSEKQTKTRPFKAEGNTTDFKMLVSENLY